MTDIQYIKCLSIRDYLLRRGIQPARENARCGFYLSPLRAEHTPSFKVDYVQNLWYDHGTGKGWSIIDLVMGLENCDKSQATRLLGNGEISPITSLAPASVAPTVPALRILAHTPLQHAALIGYLRERGINPLIAAAYCRQVRYEINGKSYFAIGFRNDAGGWELRSERFKGGSSPKYITTLKGCNATNDMNAVIDSSAINATNDVNAITDCPAIGAIASFHAGNDPMACESDRAMSASHASVMVFEGFIDFLSYLSLANNIHPVSDTVVLNSVVNLSKAVPFLNRHSVIHAFFDNDETGRKTTSDLHRLCPRSEIIDQSCFYRRYKDVNDYLIARKTCPKPPETVSDSLGRDLRPSKAETAAIESQRRKGVKV